jgi:hypothetical protein
VIWIAGSSDPACACLTVAGVCAATGQVIATQLAESLAMFEITRLAGRSPHVFVVLIARPNSTQRGANRVD